MSAPSPLLEDVRTARFVLEPLGRWTAWRIVVRHWLDDAELLQGLTPGAAPGSSALGAFFSMERPNRRTKFSHAVRLRADGRLIGMHQFRLVPHRTARPTIVIHDRTWWGQGVVPEIRAALLERAFTDPRVDRIEARVAARNVPSVFNYRRLGFAHVGTLHRALPDGQDILVFELLRAAQRPCPTTA